MPSFIFDLGGVLIDLAPDSSLQQMGALLDWNGNLPSSFSPLNASRSFTIGDLVGTGETGVVSEYQRGLISTSAFAQSFLCYCKQGTTEEQFLSAWDAMIVGLPKERLEAVQSLRKYGKVCLLSNTNEEHWRYTTEHIFRAGGYEIADYFDHVFLSHEMHLAKPDVKIFEEVIRIANLDSNKSAYIDDLQINLNAGAVFGLHPHCITGFSSNDIPKILASVGL